MATISELRKQREDLFAKHTAIVDAAEAEARALNAEESAADDKLIADIKTVDSRIDLLVKTGDLRERASKPDGNRPAPAQPQATPPNVTANSNSRLLKYHGGGHAGYATKEAARRSGLYLMAAFGPESVRDHARELCRDEGIEYRADMSSSSPTGGGAFIFDEFSNAVIDMAENFGVFRQNAQRWPMASDTLIIPKVTSGQTSYFLTEGSAGTESDITSTLVTLTAQALGTLTQIPRELMEDSAINLAALVTRNAALSLATKEDVCGFIGDGTSTYGNITGLTTACNAAAGSLITAVSGNTAFSTLDLYDFQAVIGSYPMYPGSNPKWYISKPGWAASMQRLALAQGGASEESVSTGGTTGARFLGYPVVFTSQGVLPTTLATQTSTIVALFGDLSMSSAFGDRRAISMEVDYSYAFTSRLATLMCWERFAINNHTIVDPRNSSNPGPILALKTPGS